MEDTNKTMNELQKNLKAIISNVIKAQVPNEIKLFENDRKNQQPQIIGLSNIWSEGNDGIIKALSLKAEKNDVEQLYETKANQEELQKLVMFINDMSKLLQHLIVLLSESLKVNLLKANETRV